MQPPKTKIALFWHRRDLRLSDNAGLYNALKSGYPVLPMFILDRDILDRLSDRNDARVTFIHDTLAALQSELKTLGSTLLVRHGHPIAIWEALANKYDIAAVYTNRDYEPSAMARDQAVADLLAAKGIPLHSFKDQVIFEGHEVLKDDGKPYTVFTPYSRKWKAKLEEGMQGKPTSFYFRSYPTERYFGKLLQTQPLPMPTLGEIGFERSEIRIPGKEVATGLIKNYHETRDFPAQLGTSRLGIHFRFGTISIREKARKAAPLNVTYLNELIWRDFYAMILQHFPHVVTGPFRPQYDAIQWRNDEREFEAWCKGETGYPIVDAGMRELNATGFMHNRVRIIVASFLTKHLLIDWRWGEAYFAEKLLDFDLASNNGGWQWAAGCGTDAAPYFRIFNPDSQQQKFDPKFQYIRQWVPEFGTPAYPRPIVDHKTSRERCLVVYKAGLGAAAGEES
ncbi:MAG TPA: deoxyribodipyrimidine photo-lyase [Bacteroidia bacterium]|nr:deoxyribodipyrimidine photo-lyase [Bacteroidia bacterium]